MGIDLLFEQIRTLDGVERKVAVGRFDQCKTRGLRQGQNGSDDPFAPVEVDVGCVFAVDQHDDRVVDYAGVIAQFAVDAAALGEGFGEMGLEEMWDVWTDQTDHGDRAYAGRG